MKRFLRLQFLAAAVALLGASAAEAVPDQLVITGPTQTPTFSCSSAFTITAKSGGVPVVVSQALTVQLSQPWSTFAGFMPEPTCNDANWTQSIVIPAGQSSAVFYAKDYTDQIVRIIASASGVATSGQIDVTFGTPPPPLSWEGADLSIKGACNQMSLRLAQSQASNVVATLTENANATFHSDVTCTSAVTSVTIPAGSLSVPVYFNDPNVEALTITASATLPVGGAVVANKSVPSKLITAPKVLVLRVSYADKSLNDYSACSVANLTQYVFTDTDISLERFIERVSYGNANLQNLNAGSVMLNVTIPTLRADACVSKNVTNPADDAARVQGVEPNDFESVVYYAPDVPGCCCLWGGNKRVLLYASCGDQNGLNHEVGHGWTLGHAEGVWAADPFWATASINDCGTTGEPACGHPGSDAPGFVCTTDRTWDHSTVMGATCAANLVAENAPSVAKLGWLPATQVQEVTADGQYQISALERDPALAGNPQLLKIKTSTHGYYYLSYRKHRSDITVPPSTQIPSPFFSGVSIHADQKGFTGRMGEALPPDATVQRLVGVLKDGESFVDSTAGVTVTQVSSTANVATINIDLATCP